MNKAEMIDIVGRVEGLLTEKASEKSRKWWERYMRDVISFRGVGIPQIRELVKEVERAYSLEQAPLEKRFELLEKLFAIPYSEEKLFAILYMQLFLVENVEAGRILGFIEQIFAKQYIYDWNCCDWLCVRILQPLAEQSEESAQQIGSWKEASYLWKARSSLVPYVQSKRLEHFIPLADRSAELLIRREERFAKTAVGWYLRELSRLDSAGVVERLRDYKDHLTLEVFNNALKYMDKDQRKKLKGELF